MVNFQDILDARKRIRKYIWETPLDFSMNLSTKERNVFLKLECQQKLKSFKIRGALNKLISLTPEERRRGVMTVSSGNHGAGVSYGTSLLKDMKATVFVPVTTPEVKIEKIKYYGAEIQLQGQNYDETYKIAMNYAKERQLTFIDSSSDREVIAGQGTIAMEILEKSPEIDTILVPIGGGGMITGIGIAAKAIKPSIKVIGVQTAACPAMVQSLKNKVCYIEFPTKASICEALVGGVGEIPYHMAGNCIDDILLVEEASIRKAVLDLMYKEKVVAEPSGAIGYAAYMTKQHLFKGKNTAIIISGGNINFQLAEEIFVDTVSEAL
ncbi:threonine dehydratase biosynthetic [Clostridium aceticum]|uniref:threonine ammonia-lyase n=1 Tax=Clostridium aceticum TaxID=84022 RepID=A0A0D8IHS7_9CLOT|nr:threonine/serine dehydratase [Clostridium aceticum]AKL94230.1 threonine dehydratase biosynthetic [Clostridium aceticum]KJF28746.1 pyridoxal-5'-phosphate-dependent protein subunit beta [Clostridium aceticum]